MHDDLNHGQTANSCDCVRAGRSAHDHGKGESVRTSARRAPVTYYLQAPARFRGADHFRDIAKQEVTAPSTRASQRGADPYPPPSSVNDGSGGWPVRSAID